MNCSRKTATGSKCRILQKDTEAGSSQNGGDGMVKTGIGMIVQLLGCMFKGVVGILMHVLKLALAVLEIILFLVGSALKVFLLVLA